MLVQKNCVIFFIPNVSKYTNVFNVGQKLEIEKEEQGFTGASTPQVSKIHAHVSIFHTPESAHCFLPR